jgi:hypothetical protein
VAGNMGSEERRSEAPAEVRHRVQIYHLMYTGGGHYEAKCSCGVKSPWTMDGRMAFKWMRQFHPEGLS